MLVECRPDESESRYHQRAADALIRIAPLGISSPVSDVLWEDAKGALRNVIQFNKKLFETLDTERFFFCVRPYYKPFRVGRQVFRGSNAGDFAGINELDLLLGLAVTLVVALVISTDQGGRLNPDAIAYGFAICFGALMLFRRRYPVAVLVLTMLLLFAYYTLGYPAIGLAVPVIAALYSAAERGHTGAAVVVSFLLLSVSTHFRLRDGESAVYLLGYESVTTVALMAAAIALGINRRSRRALRAEQDHSARLIALEHAYRAEQRVQSERAQIARDLHDVIGHSISVISLHAGVAREAIGRDDEEARQALTHIQAASSAAMRELRATVRVLRTPAQALEVGSAVPAPPEGVDPTLVSLANLSLLVANAAAGGLHVEVRTQGDLNTLPAVVDAAAFRAAAPGFILRRNFFMQHELRPSSV